VLLRRVAARLFLVVAAREPLAAASSEPRLVERDLRLIAGDVPVRARSLRLTTSAEGLLRFAMVMICSWNAASVP
jgi:hypothetical protein